MTSASSGEPTTSRGGSRWLSRSVPLAESARTFARCSWCVTDHDPQEAAMNLRGSFLTVLTVATMIVSPLAYAATTSTVMPFPTPTITNPCNGEDVNVSGNVHMTIGVTIDGNGGSHLRIHINNQDVSGIGVGTGSRYQIPTTLDSSADFCSAATMTPTVKNPVVAPGSTPKPKKTRL